mgnify:CR=1 FL=1
MRQINYDLLMEHTPYHLKSVQNSRDQIVNFYEDPIQGDMAPIIGVIEGKAFYTEFFDTADFYLESDYLPVITEDGTILHEFELDRGK